MASVALVLGAGGLTGGAWTCGVLGALDEVVGWDARDAELIVGTSAGARVGATLRLGFSPADHHAGARFEPLSVEGALLAAGSDPAVRVLPRPEPRPRTPAAWLPQSPLAALRGLTRLPNPRLGAVGLLPRGTAPTGSVGAGLRDLDAHAWPERPLWITAIRLRDGARVVFGRDPEPEVDLPTAVDASAAVPSWFSPVEVDGEAYIDGGSDSPTNAELVAGLGFDLAVVLSPMSAVSSVLRGRPSPMRAIRALHAQTLAREVARIRRSGTHVLTFQPTAEDLEAMGPSSLDGSNTAAIAEQAHEAARRRLADGRARELVALLERAAARHPR